MKTTIGELAKDMVLLLPGAKANMEWVVRSIEIVVAGLLAFEKVPESIMDETIGTICATEIEFASNADYAFFVHAALTVGGKK